MKEQVSALMDGELEGPESEGCIKRLKGDPEVREAWDLYHLIGDSMRGDIAGSLPSAFNQRLAQEPTVLAPRRGAVQRHPAWFALSAAASVAAVAYVGWMAIPMLDPSPQPQIAAAPAAVRVAQPVQMLSAVPASQPASSAMTDVIPVTSDMSDYFIAHQRFSSTSAMVGVAPYARSVSQDYEKR